MSGEVDYREDERKNDNFLEERMNLNILEMFFINFVNVWTAVCSFRAEEDFSRWL